MKKFKAFTLIELIVAIAIFGILMTGVIQLIAPINSAATESKVLNNQQMVENSILTYIGENTRYASNMLIVEEGVKLTPAGGSQITVDSAEHAIDAFFAYCPVNTVGVIDPAVDANRKKVSVICFDHDTAYSYVNKTYTGRLISSVDTYDANGKIQARSTALDFSAANLSPAGDKPQYLVFGNDYYGPGEFRLSNISIDSNSHVMNLSVASEYYYSNGKIAGKSSDTSANAMTGTYELRNYGTGDYIFKCLRSASGSGNGISIGKTDSKKVYFVFIKEGESLVVNGALSQTEPTLNSGADVTTSGTVNTGETTTTVPDETTPTTTTAPTDNTDPAETTAPAETTSPAETTTNAATTKPGGSTGGESGSNTSGDNVKIDTKVTDNISVDSNRWSVAGEQYGGKILLSSESGQIIIFEKSPGVYHIQTYPDWQNITNGDVSTTEAIKALEEKGYIGIQLA